MGGGRWNRPTLGSKSAMLNAHGSITLHPDGVPHGPHPGRTEESIGQTHTDELAVMVDSFRPLVVSKNALAIEDKGYYQSWLER